ncbi:MAG: TIR domain-containing protein [Desulfovibrio sp.]|nr:MAG: TIR domain-containing protein [Desulfovibrio sp.]
MLCPGCFGEKGGNDVCPACGFDASAGPGPLALPYGTLLNNKYLTGRLLGRPGGFGLTYLAWDTVLQVAVAVKEYLPREAAGRDADRSTVVPHSSEDGASFEYGLKKFLAEARTLAKFRHPNVVRVLDFFEANSTAYLVMDYYEGENLVEHVRRAGGRLPERRAVDVILPVLMGLKQVHAQGFLHRDVKPHNIYLTRDGAPILLDFGAARQAVGEHSRGLSVFLTPGFSPYEQYHSHGEIGPWSDVYASGATLYYLLTGHAPPEAPGRREDDELACSSKDVGAGEALCSALEKALAVRPQDRYQDIGAFEAALLSHAGASGWEVFLCKKSADLAHARQVYDFLESRGIRAFLSELAIPEVSEAEYRRVIDQAVEDCEHFVVVGSSRENVESSWVEAEWGMFLNEKRSGRKQGNLVTVLAQGMAIEDLPVGLRNHQVVPLTPAGLLELLRFVAPDRIPEDLPAPAPEPSPEPVPEPSLEPVPEPEPEPTAPSREPSAPSSERTPFTLENESTPRSPRPWLLVLATAIFALVGVAYFLGPEMFSGEGTPEQEPVQVEQVGVVNGTQEAGQEPESGEGEQPAFSTPMPGDSLPRSAPKAGDTWVEQANTSMEFVWIPGGCFTMGSPVQEAGRNEDETPHHVCIDGFWLARYETSNAEYAVADSGHDSGSYREAALNEPEQPAVKVSYEDAVRYAQWLSQAYPSLDFTLPTEAQWEYAARAGEAGATPWEADREDACRWASVYDMSSATGLSLAWEPEPCMDQYIASAPVGSFKANGFGVGDMLGNVWEWTADAYAEDNSGLPERNPLYRGSPDSDRVLRGGSWFNPISTVRFANRIHFPPDTRDFAVGFRLAMIDSQAAPREALGRDASPDNATSSLPSDSLTSVEIGMAAGDIYVEALEAVVLILEDKPEPSDHLWSDLAELKAWNVERMIELGRLREDLDDNGKDQCDVILRQEVENTPTAIREDFQRSWQFYADTDPELASLITQFTVLYQYVDFDVLRTELPEEAARFGIE